MNIFRLLVLITILQGCAIDLDYVRPNPSIKGTITSDTNSTEGLTVLYANGHDKNCKRIIAKTVTDQKGEFRIKLKRKLKLIQVVPVDGCSFSGYICIPDAESWKFAIKGIGEKEFHTGENIIREPSALFFQSSEGICEPPKWLTLECDLNNLALVCEITNNLNE